MEGLSILTEADWRTLAAVTEGEVYVYGTGAHLDRLRAAGIVSGEGSCVHREITQRGHGVIAAARVLVPRTATEVARFFKWSQGLPAGSPAYADEPAAVRPGSPKGARAILWQEPPHPHGCKCFRCDPCAQP